MVPAVNTNSETKPATPIKWYRTPIDPELHKELHRRSDFLGLLQTLGYLSIYTLTAGTALVAAARHWPVLAVLGFVFLHGMVTAFMINGVHELGHNTVFKSNWLNSLFVRKLSFLGWINFQMFNASHTRHHRYTLHPPDDLEVVLPIKIMIRNFFLQGFINPAGNPIAAWNVIKDFVRIARGQLRGEWELTLFPANDPAKRRLPVNWARTVLIGHALIMAGSIAGGFVWHWLWLVPVLITFAPFFGGWLFFLCNNTQHIGLQDNVPDFRLCCRTFMLNPVVRFLYWHMNYHTEHHMYAAVPCYRLGKLHAAIKHELPPCPAGIIATWQQIAEIQRLQKSNPSYQYAAPLPVRQ